MSRRNYKSMGDAKLIGCAENLSALDAEDKARVVAIMAERGLSMPKPAADPKDPGMRSWMVPMLCVLIKPDELGRYPVENYAAEAKIDGIRAICWHTGERIRMFNGRNASEHSGQLPYIDAALIKALPPDSCVDGELMSPLGFNGVGSAVARGVSHTPSAALPALTLVVFDVLRWDGEDKRKEPWTERRALVEELGKALHFRPSIIMEPSLKSYEQALEVGFEGLVVKRRSSTYTNGRSSAWGKVKQELTIECEIVNLPKDGKGSLSGMVGAVEFRLPNGEIGRASGMNGQVRQEMTDHPERYIGKVGEFAYQLMTKDGRLRHPRWKRLREDLAATS